MLDFLKRINWGLIAALLFCLGTWGVVGWALYHGFNAVQ